MSKIAFGVEYCGTNYFGWQRQEVSPTIQECIESALSRVADQPIHVICAGRTDTGVHAIQQVIHTETGVNREMHAWLFGSNSYLPPDISLVWARKVDDSFHARFSATTRTYRYIILNRTTRSGILKGRVTWECRPLDIELMKKAAACLIGKHDFTSFRALNCQAKNPVRKIIRLQIEKIKNLIVVEIEADAFLQHMVRNIMGVLLKIGMGKAPVNWSKEVLEAKDRNSAGITAPPDGLYLMNILYPKEYEIPEPDLSVGQIISQC